MALVTIRRKNVAENCVFLSFNKLEVPCKARKQSNGNSQFQAEVQ